MLAQRMAIDYWSLFCDVDIIFNSKFSHKNRGNLIFAFPRCIRGQRWSQWWFLGHTTSLLCGYKSTLSVIAKSAFWSECVHCISDDFSWFNHHCIGFNIFLRFPEWIGIWMSTVLVRMGEMSFDFNYPDVLILRLYHCFQKSQSFGISFE